LPLTCQIYSLKKTKLFLWHHLNGVWFKLGSLHFNPQSKEKKYIFSKYLLPTEQYLLQCIFITGHQIKFSHLIFC